MMRIFVKYNQAGELLSVSKMDRMPAGLDHPYGLLNENEAVLEASNSQAFLELSAMEIHETYRVDVANETLVEKQ
jgi:hypothetical protein